MIKYILPIAGFLFATNCGLGSQPSVSDVTKTSFEPQTLGIIPFTYDRDQPIRTGTAVTNDLKGGYRYIVGGNSMSAISGPAFQAESGLITTTNLKAPTIVSGNAKYSGTYKAGSIKEIKLSGNQASGSAISKTSPITLTANFSTKTLTGTSQDGLLNVNGSFSGRDITGRVLFRKTGGTLQGQISDDVAIGAFHGGNNDNIYAGGFLLNNDK